MKHFVESSESSTFSGNSSAFLFTPEEFDFFEAPTSSFDDDGRLRSLSLFKFGFESSLLVDSFEISPSLLRLRLLNRRGEKTCKVSFGFSSTGFFLFSSTVFPSLTLEIFTFFDFVSLLLVFLGDGTATFSFLFEFFASYDLKSFSDGDFIRFGELNEHFNLLVALELVELHSPFEFRLFDCFSLGSGVSSLFKSTNDSSTLCPGSAFNLIFLLLPRGKSSPPSSCGISISFFLSFERLEDDFDLLDLVSDLLEVDSDLLEVDLDLLELDFDLLELDSRLLELDFDFLELDFELFELDFDLFELDFDLLEFELEDFSSGFLAKLSKSLLCGMIGAQLIGGND